MAPKVGDASIGVRITSDGTTILQNFALVGPTLISAGVGGLIDVNADEVAGLLGTRSTSTAQPRPSDPVGRSGRSTPSIGFRHSPGTATGTSPAGRRAKGRGAMPDTKLTTSAGEHWVCLVMSRLGWGVALTRDDLERTDILAVSPTAVPRRMIEVQVKA
jgi:hypothetical protein